MLSSDFPELARSLWSPVEAETKSAFVYNKETSIVWMQMKGVSSLWFVFENMITRLWKDSDSVVNVP